MDKKGMKIVNLVEQIGKEMSINVILTEVLKNSNQTGNVWTELLVQDSTGKASFKVWGEASEQLAQMGINLNELIGKAVTVTGVVELWQNKAEVNVLGITPMENYSLDEYFPSLTDEDKAYLKGRLQILISNVKDEAIRALLESIFSCGLLERMLSKCGGTTHHVYIGGLLAHLVQTAELAYQAADCNVVGPYRRKANTDIVLAGALLHDVGKLTTLEDTPGKLSDRGFYVSHSLEATNFVNGYNRKLQPEKRVKDLSPIIHIIESCGKNGDSRTIEATLVQHCDRLSREVDAIGFAFSDGASLERNGKVVFSKEKKRYVM